MRRLVFALSLATIGVSAFSALASCSTQRAEASTQPDIILIFAEDISIELGC